MNKIAESNRSTVENMELSRAIYSGAGEGELAKKTRRLAVPSKVGRREQNARNRVTSSGRGRFTYVVKSGQQAGKIPRLVSNVLRSVSK